jgi:hypothetical protein
MTVLHFELNGTLVKIESHQCRFTSLPGNGYSITRLLHYLPYHFFLNFIAHPVTPAISGNNSAFSR